MPLPLGREQLDMVSEHGCQAPGCKHQDHGKVLWMNQRCHIGAPKFLERRDDVFSFRCVVPQCGNMLVVEVKGALELLLGSAFKEVRHKGHREGVSFGMFEQGCGHGDTSAVTASYEQGSGEVKVFCYYCETQVATIKV